MVVVTLLHIFLEQTEPNIEKANFIVCTLFLKPDFLKKESMCHCAVDLGCIHPAPLLPGMGGGGLPKASGVSLPWPPWAEP